MHNFITTLLAVFAVMAILTAAPAADAVPPLLNAKAIEGMREDTSLGCRNLFSIPQLQASIKGDEKGLVFDISGVTALLDGSTSPTYTSDKVYGMIYMGPYPFEDAETNYSYKRFRRFERVTAGKANLDVNYLMSGAHNSENWTDLGQATIRFELMLEQDGADRKLGVYDTYIRFRKTDSGFVKLPSLVEGPFVCLTTSNNPDQAVIAVKTDVPAAVTVKLSSGQTFGDAAKKSIHEIPITGLLPDTRYSYTLLIDGVEAAAYNFKSAPKPGHTAATVRFAYCGDSREGVGGGTRAFMGHNAEIFERIMNQAYMNGADFFIMGGDLVNGYTAVKDDFATQLQAWKQTVSGFWHERPVYPAIGNHESLLRVFIGEDNKRIRADRWPYDTDSAEAVFAAEFVNPVNGPKASDPRRPTYIENVYSFQYGPVYVIAFNNNYWVSYSANDIGGCPEGVLLDDQLDWIKAELKCAEAEASVKYVVLYAQEPVFPNGGHLGDAMWYNGDNTVRAKLWDPAKGELLPGDKGVLNVRDEFVRAVAASTKVAAVLGSDEHGYHKTLISRDVPVGNIARDDKDKDGRIRGDSETPTPLDDLKNATWYLVCGGGGAPYYSHQDTPWNTYWMGKDNANAPSREKNYYYSSQPNFFLFEAGADFISVKIINHGGEEIDRIDNLMAVKAQK